MCLFIDSVVGDNGPQFSSSQFGQVCNINGVKSLTIPHSLSLLNGSFKPSKRREERRGGWPVIQSSSGDLPADITNHVQLMHGTADTSPGVLWTRPSFLEHAWFLRRKHSRTNSTMHMPVRGRCILFSLSWFMTSAVELALAAWRDKSAPRPTDGRNRAVLRARGDVV